MTANIKRATGEGMGFGLLAGLVFAMLEIAVAGVMGESPLMPIRMFASIVLGPGALTTASIGTAAVVGVALHLVLSAAFGTVYVLTNDRLTARARTGWARQASSGSPMGLRCGW